MATDEVVATPEKEAPATPAERHPLAKMMEAIGTWERWKEQWEATDNAELMFSLLHHGFMVEAADKEERICFYLDVADGHALSLNFQLSGESSGYYGSATPCFLGERMLWCDIRQRIARKAFEVIVNAVFKDRSESGDRDHPSWLWIIRRPALVDKVLWFFRVEKDGSRIGNAGIYGAETTAYGKIVHSFLAEFAMRAWTFECFGRYTGPEDLAIQQQLRERRPQFIEVLWGINELYRLLDPRYELDEACMAKLEELAFRRKLYLPTEKKEESYTRWDDTHRKPATLAEAHYGKSMPAIVLTHRRIVAAEQERFNRLRELSERRDELEREQAALQTAT